MAKIKADDLIKLSIWKLSRSGLFKNSGLCVAASNQNDIFAYITFIAGYKEYIIIKFPNSSIMQTVYITNTPCYIGGKRDWFLCPDCHKQVGVLYLSEMGYFACKGCLNLTYQSKNKNYRKKSYDFLKRFDNYFRANKLTDQLKRFSYKGKSTAKMKKIENLYKNSIFFNSFRG